MSTKAQREVKIDEVARSTNEGMLLRIRTNKLYLERRNRRNTMLDVCASRSFDRIKSLIHEEGFRISV